MRQSQWVRVMVLGLLLCAGGREAAAQLLPAGEESTAAKDGPLEIELGVSAGLRSDRSGPAAPNQAAGDTAHGVDLSELISRIYAYRSFRERLVLDIDYDASRAEEFLPGEGNSYALHYLGRTGELVRFASIGSRLTGVSERTSARVGMPGPQEVGASITAAHVMDRGRLSADALVRYGASEQVALRFTGDRRDTEIRVSDFDHIRRTLYFLPDTGIDERSLVLYRSVSAGGELTAGGVRYERLVRTIDYDFESRHAWVLLDVGLRPTQHLMAFYEVDGAPVGTVGLGLQAFIDESGTRVDFTQTAFPEYFVQGDSLDYLVLAEPERATYWELRNAYRIAEPAGSDPPENIEVSLLLASTGRVNAAYESLVAGYQLNADRRYIAFLFEDEVGFYPRPFPGERPFTAPLDPGNPFDPQNPVYAAEPPPDDRYAINTIRIRYSERVDGYEIPDLFVTGSVTVEVDGVRLAPHEFDVDESTGMVEIDPSRIRRASEVVVAYRRAADEQRGRAVHGGAGVRYESARGSVGAAAGLRVPVTTGEALPIGAEQPPEISIAADYQRRLLPENSPGTLEVAGESELHLAGAGQGGVARIADMQRQSGSQHQTERTPIANATPATLALRYITATTDEALAAAPLSESFPADYASTQGSIRYRRSVGHEEEALEMKLVPVLQDGERAYGVARIPYDSLSAYERVVLFFFRAPDDSTPPGLRLDIRATSGENDYIGAKIDPALLAPGWNRVELPLDQSGRVLVNGEGTGLPTVAGRGARLAYRLEVGFVADGLDVTEGMTLWTDEWHAAGAAWRSDVRATVSAGFSWPEDLVSIGTFPVVGALRADAAYGVSTSNGVPRHEGSASGRTSLVRSVEVAADWRGVTAAAAATEKTTSFEGEVGFDTGAAWIPWIRHGISWSDALGSTTHEAWRGQRRSMRLEAGVPAGDRSAVAHEYERTIRTGERVVVDPDTGESTAPTGQTAVVDRHASRLVIADGRALVTARMVEAVASEQPHVSQTLADAYGDLAATLLVDPTGAVATGRKVSRRVDLEVSVKDGQDRVVGADLAVRGALGERGPDLSAEPGTVRDELSARTQFRLDAGALRLQPTFSRDLTAEFTDVPAGRSWSTVQSAIAPAIVPPFWYTAPGLRWSRLHAVTALDALRAGGSNSATLQNEIGIVGRYRGTGLGMPNRFAASLRSRLIQSGPVYRIVESQRLSAGKTVTWALGSRTAVFTFDSAAEHQADLLADTRRLDVSWSLFYAGTRTDGTSLQISNSGVWSRSVYRPDDPLLRLFVDEPDREPPSKPAADADRWDSTTSITYRWQSRRPAPSPTPIARRLAVSADPLSVRSELSFLLETSHVITDAPTAEPVTTLPLRVTLAHSAEVRQNENLSIRLGLRTQGGYEHTRTDSGVRRTAAVGVEGRLAVVISY